MRALHQAGRWGRDSPAGDLSPCPGNGTKHDSEGTGCQGGEEAEVEHALHPVIAHPHHGIQVVLQRSNTRHDTELKGRKASTKTTTMTK